MCGSFYGGTPSGCMFFWCVHFTSMALHTHNQHNALVVCYDFTVASCCYLNTCVSKLYTYSQLIIYIFIYTLLFIILMFYVYWRRAILKNTLMTQCTGVPKCEVVYLRQPLHMSGSFDICHAFTPSRHQWTSTNLTKAVLEALCLESRGAQLGIGESGD